MISEKIKWPFKFIYYIIPFNIFYDFIGIYNPGRNSNMSLFRGFVILAILIIPYAKKLKINKLSVAVFLFAVYVTSLFPFVSDLSYSINVSGKVFISLFMLPIGFYLIDSEPKFNHLIRLQTIILLFICVGFLANEIFNLGGYSYSEAVEMQFGSMRDNWNVLTYSLLISPLILLNGFYKIPRKERLLFVILFIVVLIFIAISFKRVAIAGVIVGASIFVFNYRKYQKIIFGIIGLFIVLAILSPFYVNIISKQAEARAKRFTFEGLREEARYRESFFVWGDVFGFESYSKSFFGKEAFASKGNYAEGRFGKRMLHVDYNLILSTCGIFGLVLYLNIYLSIYKLFKKLIPFAPKEYGRLLKSVFFSLLLTSLFTSLAGQMYQPTFRIIIFLYIGAILGVLNSFRKNHYIKMAIKVKAEIHSN